MKWTTEQEKAIATRHKNLLVSAAAGSGKTALLIERIRRMVAEEHVSVDDLLILTFTRAAAGEMKERLTRAFSESLRAVDPKDKQQVHWLVTQMQILPTAAIDTFDAFCGRVVREYFQVADVDPDFRVGDRTELEMLYESALDDVFEAAYAQIPEDGETAFSRLVDRYASARSDQGLRDQVTALRTFLNVLPEPEDWCADAVAELKKASADFSDSKWHGYFVQMCRRTLEDAVSELHRAADYVAGDPEFEKTCAQLTDDAVMVQGVAAAADQDWETFRSALKAAHFDRYKGSRKNKEDSAKVKALRDHAKKSVTELQDFFDAPAAEDQKRTGAMAEVMADLIALTKAVEARFSALKKERGILDFADIERDAYTILKDPDIADSLRQHYAAVFVDEYQDTNALQEGLISQILRADNYFMVGDVKQSIYRFRQADPSIFIKKYRTFGGGAAGTDELITLGKNFRSNPGIIAGVNDLFEKIMTEDFGQIPYDDKARLVQGAASDEDPVPSVVRVFEAPSDTRLAKEGEWIAKQINALVGKKIKIAKSGEEREIRYHDIVILMRSTRNRGDQIAQVLEEQGIPTYFEGGTSYFEVPEIEWMLDLIRIIDNYRQDVPLMTVMLSSVSDFTVNDLSEIRLTGGQKTFYACVDAAAAQPTALGKKLRRWLDQLKAWRKRAFDTPVSDFLWQLYSETGFYIWAGSLPGGKQRQKNLDALIKKAEDYQTTTLHGIFRFVDYVEQVQKRTEGDDSPGILSENDDVVQIMTIHKSKGLEFPVVFLADTAKYFNMTDSSRPVILDQDLGISPDYIDGEKRISRKTLVHRIAAQKMKMDNLEEEMRLLYVAMTRAMARLYITGSAPDLEKAADKWTQTCDVSHLKTCRNFLDWIMLALYQPGSKDQASSGAFRIVTGNEAGEADIETEKPAQIPEPLSEQDEAEISRRLAWRYPPKKKQVLPVKIGVTEAVRLMQKGAEQKKLTERLPVPDFLKGSVKASRRFSAAELGTGMHAVLRHLDLSKIRDVPETDGLQMLKAEGRIMVKRGLIDEALFDAIETKGELAHAAKFLAGALGQRMAKARRIEREWPFDLAMPAGYFGIEGSRERLLLQGMIDCCFLEEQEDRTGWILLDYKTDDWCRSERGKAQTLAQYRRQIGVYRKALETLTPYPVFESYLCFLTMERIEKIEA
ncbi:MAG: helicase-exonuclease AddAB subunit AddA [Pseudoramibacter sp.]